MGGEILVRVEPFDFCSCSNWVNLKEEMSCSDISIFDNGQRGRSGELCGFIQRDEAVWEIKSADVPMNSSGRR